jgi:hypothetical protein
MILMTLKLNEVEKGEHKGITIELKRDMEGATEIETYYRDLLTEALGFAIDEISKVEKANLLHFDKDTSEKFHDQFFNSLGVETIEQRRERLNK